MMKQARDIRDAQKYAANNSKSDGKKSILAKRFWQHVRVDEVNGQLNVMLDHRPVRLPNKQVLCIPTSKPQLATAVALEWDLLVSAQQALKTDYIPMTSLAARALDIEAADAAGQTKIRDDIIRYFMRVLSTDTLLCWAPEKVLNDVLQDGKTLRELQEEVATGIMSYLTSHVWPGVELKPTLDPDSIIPQAQPEATLKSIKEWCERLPPFELAGLERAVLASKSLLVGARLIHEWSEAFAQARPTAAEGTARFGIEEAATASTLEVRWQTVQWGEVEDTHDVEREDMKRQLGSAILLVGGSTS